MANGLCPTCGGDVAGYLCLSCGKVVDPITDEQSRELPEAEWDEELDFSDPT